MDTLEERNLNRLRNGKMMLAFNKKKKSFGIALLLTIFVGALGAHRFYLGHYGIGLVYLALFILINLTLQIGDNSAWLLSSGFILFLTSVFSVAIFVEIVVSYWVVGRENDRIKARLSAEYGVLDYKVKQ